MSLDVRTGYSGRTLFVTGGSGFVGKVLLYKVLKEFPDVGTVYLLMRGKKSRKLKKYLNPQERLELEVLGSPCFDPLRAALGDAAWRSLAARVRAVDGDITRDRLGLSAENYAKITSETQLIVHMAATVNFNERLDLAVQMNTLGGLRVLSLARACGRLEAMVHVSTCYVNYSRHAPGEVNEEAIYPTSFDPEDMCKHILSLDPVEVPYETRRLLKNHGFPNTYTLTKNIGEQLIQRYKGNLPVVIVRPSIVGSSLAEPMPGWVDALTAAGGILLTATLGVLRDFVCFERLIADLIPVDFVVNVILKALFKCQQHYRGYLAAARTAGGSAAAVAALEPVVASRATIAAAGSGGGDVTSVQATGVKAGGGAAHIPTRVPSTAAGAAHGAQEEEEGGAVAATANNNNNNNASAAAGAGAVVPAEDPSAGLPFIYQAATSNTVNYLTWEKVRENLYDYFKDMGSHPKGMSGIGGLGITITPYWSYYLLRYFCLRYVPYLALKTALAVPHVGNEKQRKQVERMGRALRRTRMLNEEFYAFVSKEWRFDCAQARALDEGLCEESRRAFLFDPYAINWWVYIRQYAWGLLKHIVGDTNNMPFPKSPKETPAEILHRAAHL